VNLPRLTFALATLLMSSSAALAAEADADPNVLTDQNGCKVVRPEVMLGVVIKASWEGACVDGFVSGKGTLKIGPTTYTGEFEQGQIVTGEMTTPGGGGTFEGEFKANLPAGRGVYKRQGIAVSGVFDKDGLIAGPGVIEWPDGSRYEGGLDRNYLKQGQGRNTFSNGEYYEGGFLNNLRHGKGTWTSAEGRSYTGEYAFGYRDGQGTEVFEDGSRYVGGYKAGSRQGQGRFTEANGAVREGEWKADALNGKCKTREALGDEYEGDCLNGKASGHGRLKRVTDESVYEGEFTDGQFHGQGRLTAPGYAYEGAFAVGMKTGRGKEVFESGEQYEGDFVRNQRTGQGVLRLPVLGGKAMTYDGMLKNGEFEGPGTLTFDEISFQGEFKQGVLVRGVMRTADKTIEVDAEKATYLEVLKDGTKVPVDPSVIALPEA
jgi:hypothetical protein